MRRRTTLKRYKQSLTKICKISTCLLLLTSLALSQENFENSKFKGFLDSGEYAAASQMVAPLRGSLEGDQRLAEIAKSQLTRGAFRQATATLNQIRSNDIYASAAQNHQEQLSQYNGLLGGRGGGIQADFDPLMELIQRTVEPESWEDLGGMGRMSPFEAGVHVDAEGMLRMVTAESGSNALDRLRGRARHSLEVDADLGPSKLRLISLPRLERAIQQRHREGLPPTNSMKYLGGLTRIQYVLVYPETGDLVIAGPAEGWELDSAGRPVGIETGKPLLWLDDLVSCWRAVHEDDGIFGCSIDPLPENLVATQNFLADSRATGRTWREGLREALGRQKIMIHGIEPTSHAAHILVKADYHMKRVGMGLEAGVLGVPDVLTLMASQSTSTPPSKLIRWWFTLDYEAVETSEDKLAYALSGSGVKVLSENEFLDDTGRRRATGTSDQPTREFAANFTNHFGELAEKYPVYADLRNVFDIAMVCGLIAGEGLNQKVGWQSRYFGVDSGSTLTYPLEVWSTPREVDTIMNHKIWTEVTNGRKRQSTLVGVSGGVSADIQSTLETLPTETDEYQTLSAQQMASRPETWDASQWWWDR